MILSELIERVRVYLDDLSANRVSDATLRASANAVIRDLWIKLKRVNPDWAQSSVALSTQVGVNSVALPSDFGTFTRLEYSNDHSPLLIWRWPQEAAFAMQARPWAFRLEKGKVVFRATPDAVYQLTLWYERIPAALSGDSDVHALPEYFDELIVSRTALRLGAGMAPELIFLEERNLMAEMSRSRSLTKGYWDLEA